MRDWTATKMLNFYLHLHMRRQSVGKLMKCSCFVLTLFSLPVILNIVNNAVSVRSSLKVLDLVVSR